MRESLARVLEAGQRLRGCTEQEISDLCRAMGVKSEELPAGYREFLALAGRSCGRVCAGSMINWPAPMSLYGSALAHAYALGVGKRLDQLAGMFGHDLCFLQHQGHSYLLLVWDDAGERIVLLDEGEPFIHETEEPRTFPQWLHAEVEAMLAFQPDPYMVPPPFE